MDVVVKNLSYWDNALSRSGDIKRYFLPHEQKVYLPEFRKAVLENVSIHFSPGTLNAVHGYGLGCTALISLLSAQQGFKGQISGSVMYDDSIRSAGSYCDIASCSTFPLTAYFDLTVFDYLFWAARLRINVPDSECSNRAREAAQLTGLELSAPLSTLSAGGAILLSIAAELVGGPTLLLLEDPLSGLDEIAALQVVEVLGRIARRQYSSTTVVYSCRQPGHCLLRYVNRLIIIGSPKLLFSQDISVLSLCPLMKLQDNNDYDRPDLDLRDIEIQLSSVLDTVDHQLNIPDSAMPESVFGNVHEDAHKILSTYCIELLNLLSSYGLSINDQGADSENCDEDADEEHSILLRGETQQQGFLHTAPTTVVSPLVRQVQDSAGHAPNRVPRQSGLINRHRILKQGFGGGFARASKSTVEEIKIIIQRSKQNQINNGWKLLFPCLAWIISAIILGLAAPQIGEEDATGAVYNPDFATSGETLEVEYYSVSSAAFAVSITPLLLLAYNVPYLHLQFRRLREESMKGLLNQVSIWISFYCGDLPIYIVFAIIYAGITYSMVGFQGSLGSFMTVIVTLTLCFYSLSVCCAAMSNNTVTAGLHYLRFSAVCMLFAGYYELIPNVSPFWKIFMYLSPSRWAFEALMLIMYDDLRNAEIYLELFDFDGGEVSTSVTWLCIWFGCLSVLSLLLMAPITARLSRRMQQQKEKILNEYKAPIVQPKTPVQKSKNGAYNSIDHATGPVSPDPDIATLSPHSPSPLLGEQGSNYNDPRGDYDNPAVLSFPELTDGELKQPVKLASSASASGYESSPEKRAPISVASAKLSIPKTAQMKLTFRQVSYINSDFESRAADDSVLFSSAAPFSLGSYSNFENKPNESSAAVARATSEMGASSREVLLEGITGSAVPGKISAIVDGSCEGSEGILLRVLSGHADMIGKVTGDIRINGHPVSQGVRYAGVAFIPARDPVTHGCLTVREAVRFAALLCRVDQTTMPVITSKARGLLKSTAELGSLSKADKLVGKSGDVDDRVDEVIKLMGLSNVANCLIGERCGAFIGAPPASNGIAVEMGPLRGGISGAQMRCLTIAIGLVNKPALIFLENPLYGLDRHSSMIVCDVLRGLAAGGRTLVCSVQSPPPLHVFDLFDDLYLLGRGLLIYSGPTSEVVPHFDNIGFEIREGQSTVDFLLSIVSEQATLRAFGNKKGAMLSLEDLADLRRTMVDVGIKHTLSSTYNDEEELFTDGGETTALAKNTKASAAVDAGNVQEAPLIVLDPIAMGPAARVMAHRRWLTVYRSRSVVAKSFIRSFLVGCILGSIFYSINDGNVTSRITLFSLVYLYLAVFVAEILPGAHRRQRDFLRERSVGASVSLAYWLSDGAPSFIASMMQCLLLSVPLYSLVGLRPGFGYFMYFLVTVITAAHCSMGLMYICSALCPNSGKSMGLYLGILLPLQYIYSGGLLYVSDMSYLLQWIAYINPMHIFLSGLAYNEFSGNDAATGHNSDFDYVKHHYDFNTLRAPALFRILFVAFFYRFIWLLLLKLREIASEKSRLRRVVGATRRRARKLVTAGLRWRKFRNGSVERKSLLSGVGLVPVDNDDYVMMNSTHVARQPIFGSKLSQFEAEQIDRSASTGRSNTSSSEPSLAKARFSSFFQDAAGSSPSRSMDQSVGPDGRIKARALSQEDDSLRV